MGKERFRYSIRTREVGAYVCIRQEKKNHTDKVSNNVIKTGVTCVYVRFRYSK